jgi:predicted homoserine dehydrogenase-like protein
MNLLDVLAARRRPVRCAVIGCGKFATMLLSQAAGLDRLEVAAVVDLSAARAKAALAAAGYAGDVRVTVSADDVVGDPSIEVIVQGPDNPVAGTEHALAAIEHAQHVVMVTVEAEVLAVHCSLSGRARRAWLIPWPTATSRR